MKGILSFALIILTTNAFGTHLRAGYISAKPLSCLEYEITIRVYTDTNSPIRFGDGKLNFGDGTLHTTSEMQNTSPSDSWKVGFVEYIINHTYKAPGSYIISYTEENRNQNIINILQSVTLAFHIQTKLIINSAIGCFKTPVLLSPMAFIAPLGDTLNLSYAVSTKEDLIFRYELVNPLTVKPDKKNPELVPYTLPENVSINKFNGLLTWDTKFNGLYQAGEYAFTIKISYWSVNEGINHFVGYTLVDTQIILEDFGQSASITTSKDLGGYGRVYIPVGSAETIKVIYKGLDNENIELSAYTNLIDTPSAFSFTTYDSAQNFKVGLLTINSLAEIDREEPYIITVRGREKEEDDLNFNDKYPQDINLMLFTRNIFPDVITNVQDDLEWSVYPNPTTDILNLNLPADIPVFINILDLQGKKIGNWGNTKTIDTSVWSTGLYLVEIIHPNGKKVFKVVKQ